MESNDIRKDYYVYIHKRKDNGNVFYVGKGHDDRCKCFGLSNRSKLHFEYSNKYGVDVEIVKDGLTEKEAYEEEHNTIMNYITNLGYNINIDGYKDTYKNTDKFLVNKTFGGKGSKGESNPTYGKPVKDRFKCEEDYLRWRENVIKRGKTFVGENNPNYGNDTLHNKVKDNPELRIQYYARRGKQNGRCRKVDMYDKDMNFIKSFDYIGECCEYVNALTNSTTDINSVRSNISLCAKKGKTYKNYYFKLVS